MVCRFRTLFAYATIIPLSTVALTALRSAAEALCTYNGSARSCEVIMPWYRNGRQIPPGADVLIIWPDGERTTIKTYGSEGWRAGQQVLLNGTTLGQVIRVGGPPGTGIIHIRSSSGNSISFTFGD